MKLTKTTLKKIIKEEIATLKESRDDERFKSYKGIMADMPRGRDRGHSPVEMVEEALYSLKEYFDDFDGRQQPGNMQLERVEALLKELKEQLSGNM